MPQATQPQRDMKRETVERLLAVWEANPRLSLGQLWQRATRGVSIAYLFDDELVRLLELEMPKPKPVLKRAYRKQ